jgi:hypothetical protein
MIGPRFGGPQSFGDSINSIAFHLFSHFFGGNAVSGVVAGGYGDHCLRQISSRET